MPLHEGWAKACPQVTRSSLLAELQPRGVSLPPPPVPVPPPPPLPPPAVCSISSSAASSCAEPLTLAAAAAAPPAAPPPWRCCSCCFACCCCCCWPCADPAACAFRELSCAAESFACRRARQQAQSAVVRQPARAQGCWLSGHLVALPPAAGASSAHQQQAETPLLAAALC